MKKILHLLFVMAIGFAGFAQNGNTGINTKTPHANLEVTAVTSNNGIADGIISPRVTKAGLITKGAAYDLPQTSAIVYVTDASATSADAKFTNIDAIGYYYFDGTVWQKMDYSVKKWDLNGNTITDGQFLGTLNAKALQFKFSNQNAGFLNDLNTSYGVNALPFTASGTNNAAFGINVLSANTSGTNNAAIGNNALVNNTTGANNTAIGLNALRANITKGDNVAIGTYALQANNANNNVAIGSRAMTSNTVGNLNVAIGISALAANVNTNGNTAVGANALSSNIGSSNTAIGNSALKANLAGTSNTAIGASALLNNTSGVDNVSIGETSLNTNTTGSKNVAIGSASLGIADIGSDNVSVGFTAFRNFKNLTSSSDYNVALGSGSGVRLFTGKNNTFLGARSGVTAGGSPDLNYGTIVGAQAVVTGDNSSAVGGLTSVTGSNSTVIGAQASAVGAYATAIGAGSVATGNDIIVLGRATGAGNTDKIGIGTVTPGNALHVKSVKDPLKLEGVQGPPTGAYKYLIIGADGIVYSTPGASYNQASLAPTTNNETLLATIAQQAEQIKLLTASLAELKNTVNALAPVYNAQNK